MSAPSIDPLIPGLAAGRNEAFAALYDAIGASLHRAAWSMTGSGTEAEDLVQETFVSLVRARAALSGVRNLRAYVFATLRHAAGARAEKRAAERRALEAVRAHAAEAAPEPLPAAADDDRLARALASLPAEQREVLAWKIDGGLTFAEIGSALGINPNTAASRYAYALEKLRARLAAGE